ncbi:unnamed protein product [Caenorhabditis nigoni]|uniref:Uncharacterized protein n=1 Tax=Caenorhabditis nigoni TaxID=1611254 RepID=A0A2G5T281_9PELO|nr:hypothetical protein B9Z55_026312 [Caenorhabditis nigoni]
MVKQSNYSPIPGSVITSQPGIQDAENHPFGSSDPEVSAKEKCSKCCRSCLESSAKPFITIYKYMQYRYNYTRAVCGWERRGEGDE